jgi:copper chaperone CopZ
MKTVTYNIPNISCGHCVHTIKMEVSELEGVQSVEADADSQQATLFLMTRRPMRRSASCWPKSIIPRRSIRKRCQKPSN